MIILNFHCIGRPQREFAVGEEDVSVGHAQFLEILDVVSGRSDVALTFDDGNLSDVDVALPELRRRELVAEFFICAGRLQTPEFVDEDGVRELRRAGMTVGSHGMDHIPWRKLEPPALKREIVEAKLRLDDVLGAPIETAACPFGAYERRTLSALRSAGFKRVYTSDGGRVNVGDWLVARNTIRRSDSAESVQRLLSDTARLSLGQRAKRQIKRWR